MFSLIAPLWLDMFPAWRPNTLDKAEHARAPKNRGA
jgi:hypothetical protein